MVVKKRIIKFFKLLPVRNAICFVFLCLVLALAMLLCYLSSMATIYVISDGVNNEIPFFFFGGGCGDGSHVRLIL